MNAKKNDNGASSAAPCSADRMLEIHYYLQCKDYADGARQLRELADEIEAAGVPNKEGEVTVMFRTGCDYLCNRKHWHLRPPNAQEQEAANG